MCKNMTNGKSTMRERIGPEGRVESWEVGLAVVWLAVTGPLYGTT